MFKYYQESKVKIDEQNRKLAEAREEAMQIRNDCQGMIKTYQVASIV